MPLGTLDTIDNTLEEPLTAAEREAPDDESDLAIASGEVREIEDPRAPEEEDEDEPVKGALRLYLEEINAFPLLTESLEKKLADLRESSTASVVTMSSVMAPHAAQNLAAAGPIGDALRRELEAIKRAIVDRYSRIHDEEADGPMPTEPQAVLALLAKKAQTAKNPLSVRQQPAGDAALLADLFGLMKGLPRLANRVCTSEIAEVPALLAVLRDTFKRIQGAFPPTHACRRTLAAERQRLRADFLADDEMRAYVEKLAKEGKIAGIDETTAAEILTRANLRLVVSVARGYAGSPLQDRIQEGNMGLLRAVEGFESRHGVKFSTYASYWIKQSIKRAAVNTEKTVRVPAYMVELLSKWRGAASAVPGGGKAGPPTEEGPRKSG